MKILGIVLLIVLVTIANIFGSYVWLENKQLNSFIIKWGKITFFSLAFFFGLATIVLIVGYLTCMPLVRTDMMDIGTSMAIVFVRIAILICMELAIFFITILFGICVKLGKSSM